MRKIIRVWAALSAACLAGCLSACAGLSADVRTQSGAGGLASVGGDATYAMTRLPSQDASADHLRFEGLLRDELATRGFVDMADKPALYLLSVAYDTRPATIGVGGRECGSSGECSTSEAPFSLFGGRAYQHSLTLRFFERSSGTERYKVSAVTVDRDADPQHAMPLLVKSALAKLPFDAQSGWRVKLKQDKGSGMPVVISVQPVEVVR